MRYKSETIKCDGCGSIIKEPGFIINNGAHQEPLKQFGEHDICNSCLGKMFDLYIKDQKLPDDKVLEYLPKIKSLSERFGYFVKSGNDSIALCTNVSETFISTAKNGFEKFEKFFEKDQK